MAFLLTAGSGRIFPRHHDNPFFAAARACPDFFAGGGLTRPVSDGMQGTEHRILRRERWTRGPGALQWHFL